MGLSLSSALFQTMCRLNANEQQKSKHAMHPVHVQCMKSVIVYKSTCLSNLTCLNFFCVPQNKQFTMKFSGVKCCFVPCLPHCMDTNIEYSVEESNKGLEGHLVE